MLHWLGRLDDAFDLCRPGLESLALESDGPKGEILTWGEPRHPPVATDGAILNRINVGILFNLERRHNPWNSKRLRRHVSAQSQVELNYDVCGGAGRTWSPLRLARTLGQCTLADESPRDELGQTIGDAVMASLIQDRGRGPEIAGTRITVYNLLHSFLDPTVTEEEICRVYDLTPRQVAEARAYVLGNPETVLAEHLKIEERLAAGNPPAVREKAGRGAGNPSELQALAGGTQCHRCPGKRREGRTRPLPHLPRVAGGAEGVLRRGEVFMSTVKARFDGRVFVPEGPVDLPVGCELEITLPGPGTEEPANRPLVELADQLARFPENPQWPADGAAQHDHYLYGTPKKT